MIKQIGNKYVAFEPGNTRIPGEYKLRSQAMTAYQEHMAKKESVDKELKALSSKALKTVKINTAVAPTLRIKSE